MKMVEELGGVGVSLCTGAMCDVTCVCVLLCNVSPVSRTSHRVKLTLESEDKHLVDKVEHELCVYMLFYAMYV